MNKIIFVLLIYSSHIAYAGDGENLLDACGQARIMWNGGSGDKSKAMYCIGMANGLIGTLVMNANAIQNNPSHIGGICYKQNKDTGDFIGVPTGDAIRVIHNFLENNPDRLKETDVILAIHALTEQYPCSSNK